MATFGQRIDARLHQFPRLGFFNIQPLHRRCVAIEIRGWQSVRRLAPGRNSHAVLALHHVDDGFDTGALVAYSERVALPEEAVWWICTASQRRWLPHW